MEFRSVPGDKKARFYRPSAPRYHGRNARRLRGAEKGRLSAEPRSGDHAWPFTKRPGIYPRFPAGLRVDGTVPAGDLRFHPRQPHRPGAVQTSQFLPAMRPRRVPLRPAAPGSMERRPQPTPDEPDHGQRMVYGAGPGEYGDTGVGQGYRGPYRRPGLEWGGEWVFVGADDWACAGGGDGSVKLRLFAFTANENNHEGLK